MVSMVNEIFYDMEAIVAPDLFPGGDGRCGCPFF